MNRKDGIKKIIKECKNIGKITATYFYNAGICGISDFKKLGTEKTFLEIWKNNPNTVSIHPYYLYAIEGVINKCGFNQLPVKKSTN